MKNLLIATAALSLIGGAAFAQNTASPNPTLNPGATGAVASGASESQTDSTSGQVSTPTTGGAMAPDGGAPASAGSPTPAPAPAPADASTGAMASNASSSPESYPVCTSKHEDHCVNRAQATRSAKLATRHQKTDNVQPVGM